MPLRNYLIPPVNPNLPQLGEAYDRRVQEQVHSVLRLYFNQLGNALRSLLGDAGGQFVDCPNGLFYSPVTQTLAAANTGYPVALGQPYLHNNMSLTDTSRVTCSVSGVYNFQFAGQLTSTNASSKNVFVWLRRSGIDIGYSTRIYTISGSGSQSAVNWDFDIDMTAGQYLEIVWGATDTTVSLTATPATPPHPGTASAVLTVNFIAPLPLVMPVTP